MDQHILSIEMRAVTKAVDRYLGESMPQTARETTGGNAHIIMFLARNRGREIYQHTIEQKFCITRSTASRVLDLMEKKGLIARESVEHDARRLLRWREGRSARLRRTHACEHRARTTRI